MTETKLDAITNVPAMDVAAMLEATKSNEAKILEQLVKLNELAERILEHFLVYDGPVVGPDGQPLDLSEVVKEINPTPTTFLKHAGKSKGKPK